MSGFAEVIRRIRLGKTARETTGRECEVELGRAQLEVVPPFGLGVEAVRDHRQQLRRGRVRQIEDVLRGAQALRCERRLARLEHLETHRERGRVTSREVGAHERSRRAGAEDGPVPDVAIERIGSPVPIVCLRQSPDVVVTARLRVPGPDTHLVVERSGLVVPHLEEPLDAELRLSREVRGRGASAHLPGHVTNPREEQILGVARGLHELQVVTGVPPATGGIDPDVERCEIALEVSGLVRVRGQVRHRVLVVEMRRRRPKRGRDVRGAVALIPEE